MGHGAVRPLPQPAARRIPTLPGTSRPIGAPRTSSFTETAAPKAVAAAKIPSREERGPVGHDLLLPVRASALSATRLTRGLGPTRSINEGSVLPKARSAERPTFCRRQGLAKRALWLGLRRRSAALGDHCGLSSAAGGRCSSTRSAWADNGSSDPPSEWMVGPVVAPYRAAAAAFGGFDGVEGEVGPLDDGEEPSWVQYSPNTPKHAQT